MAQLITIWWRDIPAQVTARDGRRKAAVQLSDRFQEAIDRAAARADKTTTDEYLAEWRRETTECGPDLAAEADLAAAELEAAFPDEELQRYVRSGGVRPSAQASEQEEHA